MAEAQRDEIAKLEALYAANPEGHVFTHLAEAYRKAGELEHARDILAEGLGRHPESASAHVVLGRVEHDRSDDEAARRAFARVLSLDAGNLIALRQLGELALERGDRAEALGHFRELLARDVNDAEVQQAVAELSRSLEHERTPDAAPPSFVEPAPPMPDDWYLEPPRAADVLPESQAVETSPASAAGSMPPEATSVPPEPPLVPGSYDLPTYHEASAPAGEVDPWDAGEPEFLSLEFPAAEADDVEFLGLDTEADSPEGGELEYISLDDEGSEGDAPEFLVLEPEAEAGALEPEFPSGWLDMVGAEAEQGPEGPELPVEYFAEPEAAPPNEAPVGHSAGPEAAPVAEGLPESAEPAEIALPEDAVGQAPEWRAFEPAPASPEAEPAVEPVAESSELPEPSFSEAQGSVPAPEPEWSEVSTAAPEPEWSEVSAAAPEPAWSEVPAVTPELERPEAPAVAPEPESLEAAAVAPEPESLASEPVLPTPEPVTEFEEGEMVSEAREEAPPGPEPVPPGGELESRDGAAAEAPAGAEPEPPSSAEPLAMEPPPFAAAVEGMPPEVAEERAAEIAGPEPWFAGAAETTVQPAGEEGAPVQPAAEEQATVQPAAEEEAPVQPAAEAELMLAAAFEPPFEAISIIDELMPLGDLSSAGREAGGPEPGAPPEAAAGLFTETMADLYRSQGFADRAAEVYRWLLTRDPGNTRLQGLLAEVSEQAPAGAAPAEPAPREWLQDVQSVESAFTGGAGTAAGGDSLYAWSGAEEPALAGPTIGAYFRELLAWRPSPLTASPGAELLLDEVIADEPAPAAAAVPADEAVPQELMPWDFAEPAGLAESGAAESGFAGEEPGPSPAAGLPLATQGVTPVPGEPAAPITAAAVPSGETAAGTGPTAGAPAGEVDAEDEDLEMFRSWLQSLKK